MRPHRLALSAALALCPAAVAQSPTTVAATDLLPLQVGSQWVYDLRTSRQRASKPERVTVTDEAKCTLADGREVHQLRVDTAGDEHARFEAWSVGADGVVRFLARDATARGAIDFAAPPLRWLESTVRAKQAWQWDGRHDVAVACPARGWTHRATIVAVDERATVPAGSFETVHVQVTSSHGDTEQLWRDLWFAPRVGIVRERHRDDERTFERELASFRAPEDDREKRLRAHLDAELANPATPAWNNRPFVQWLEDGPETLLLAGSLAVVRTDVGSGLYFVGADAVHAIRANAPLSLAPILRTTYGTGSATPPPDAPLDSLALLLARAEATRRGFARVHEVPVTLEPPRPPARSHRLAAVQVRGGAMDGTDRNVAVWVAVRMSSDVQVACDDGVAMPR